jgi:hypothetical protein
MKKVRRIYSPLADTNRAVPIGTLCLATPHEIDCARISSISPNFSK